MNQTDNPLIILVGGAAGTGKTSLAKDLCRELNIAHRIGSGFVREIAKSFVTREENPFLYNYSFRPHTQITPFKNLVKQSQAIRMAIQRCMNRAFDEGTSIVIEGVNVIPGLIDPERATMSLILTVSDAQQHLEMARGTSHNKRRIDERDFENIRQTQQEFERTGKEHGWHIINRSVVSSPLHAVQEALKNGVMANEHLL